MSTKHTPPQWEVDEDSGGKFMVVQGEDTVIARLIPTREIAQQLVTAQQIAKAVVAQRDELLRVLENLVRSCVDEFVECPELDAAETLLNGYREPGAIDDPVNNQ